ncbi:protein kinase [Myxococcus llanfairpwllgwyngyllgogerychwyrndrobwllllantysiliogogogochensis]|uniref:non-specific serine/threonine protein kinase n=1 Tax=Myxococcus llanfairpwllgwyngyllgogerychwyrndrobwllllantysiliogogogochensis TaxID=2590453 RepID=A0A540WJI7_9BACT|nr:serine/threonine-protein kinase [Myxococcus llanfairpwllgwyngyllgogerychwyrndrobwllllantysiliogogogochensis]TQF09185.1 protein kinase [Myxococcus llanfairpwllgwyngyllgogerychwyrndrobwllllantysiliogogogochensis]
MLTVIHHPAQFPSGHTVHGWRVVKLVGAGAYGAVYKVEMNGKHYAMKVAMHRATSGDEEKADARLRRELGCLVHLRHPNIIASRAYGRWPDFESGWLYVILDFVDGYTLAEWVEKVHPTAQEVVRLFIKLSAAVDYMHGRGVFHRDLKLNNVMVRASDNEPYIIDFSAGDYTHAEDLTDAPLPPGTRRYRSPEASRFLRENGDDRDARYDFKVTDDVYALGVCLYDALTNPQPASDSAKTPVEGRAMPPDARVLNERVPGALSDAVMRFIARKPENRPPTAEAVRRELMALAIDSGPEWVTPLHTLTAKPLLTPATGTDEAVKRTRPRRGILLGALGATLAVAALAGLFASRQAGQESSAMASDEPSAQRDAGTGAPLLIVAPQEDAGMPLGTGVVSPAPVASSPGIALSPQAPVQKESPSVKRAPIVANTSESQAMKAPASSGGRAEFLKKCAAASAVVALQMGCPGSQVRPGPSACPEEAREAMFEVLRFYEGYAVTVTIDKSQPGGLNSVGVYSDGPVRGIVRLGVDELPTGTVLLGRVWTGGGALLARYTEARLPNGRTYPVCIAIGEKGAEEAEPGPQPGTVTFSRSAYGYAVKDWP